MKFLLVVSVAFLFASCGENADVVVGNKTTMEIISVFDAGDVYKGEVITAKFTIKNTGDYPLVIGEVKGSCSCTVAEKPEEPILPGGESEVVAYVNTDKLQAGPILKSVRIISKSTVFQRRLG